MNVAGRKVCADALPTPHGRLALRLDDFRREVPRSGEVGAFTIEGPKDPIHAVAEANGFLEHRVEHRREVAGRGVDDLEDFSVAVCL
jgi:hypothetical protein